MNRMKFKLVSKITKLKHLQAGILIALLAILLFFKRILQKINIGLSPNT